MQMIPIRMRPMKIRHCKYANADDTDAVYTGDAEADKFGVKFSYFW